MLLARLILMFVVVAAKVLLRYGADVHIQDRTGRSPLDLCRSDEMRRVLDPYRNARSVDTISPYYTPGGTLKTSAEPQPSSGTLLWYCFCLLNRSWQICVCWR